MDDREFEQLVALNDIAGIARFLPDEADQILDGRNFSLPLRDCPRDCQYSLDLPGSALSLLHVAAFYDNLEMFCYLLHQDPRRLGLTTASGASYLPLHYACLGGSLEVAAFILSRAPELAARECECQWQVVFLATHSGSHRILKLLFDSEYKPNLRSAKNISNQPFSQALKTRNIECLLILLDHSCNKDVGSGMSSLMQAVSQGLSSALVPLLDLGLDPMFVSIHGDSALSLACVRGDLEVVRILCGRMDNIEIPPTNGHSSILAHAITSKNIEIVRLVLKKGCDVNRYDKNDEQPIDAICGNIEDDQQALKILELVVEFGYDIHLRCPRNHMSFLDRVVKFVVKGGFPSVVRYLLSHKADPRFEYEGGISTLRIIKSWGLNQTFIKVNHPHLDIFKAEFPEEF
jgi:ankyrin repeat protein